ncbi:MAG: tetratricopeptide repeat protein [Elusimicrobia bacterium]|nr:tetratricopeptide repeat protein [Elusimicrobiota bacterium]
MRRSLHAFAAAALVLSIPLQADARRDDNANKEEEMFSSASQLFQEGNQEKSAAIDAFEKFVKAFPDSSRVADAEFLIGEANLKEALAILRAEASSKKTNAARMLQPRNQNALQALRKAQEAFSTVVSRYGKKSGLGASAQYRLGEVSYNLKDWKNAIDDFKNVEKNFQKSYLVPESWLGIIYADLALEQFSQAESNLFLLGETFPNYLRVPIVLYAQGIVSLHKGDYASAEKALKQVSTDDAIFYLGKTYLLSKRPFLAATAFERLVREYPESELREESDFFIGDSFFLAKDYDGAITKYQRFLEKYPDSRLKVAALFRIGSSYFQKKSYVDARANFQSVLDRYPQDFFAPLAQYFIAESYLVSNQMREALFAYTKVITQFPETIKISPLAHYKLAWTQFQVGDSAQATQTCHNFLVLYPTHTLAKNVYLILGNALVQLKRPNEAVTAWQRIIDLAPTSDVAEQALFSILQTQYNLKNFDSILTSYQFIFRHLPPSQSKWRSTSYLYAAEAYLSLNQVDEAQAIYEMILKVYPNEPAAFYAQDGLAWCYSFKGQDETALTERKKLKEMMSVAQSSFVFSSGNELGIADSMYNQKSYEDAFQLYDKFVKDNPKSSHAPSALYRAGMSLYHSRYYSQAIDSWQKLINDYPKAPEAQQAVYQVADTQFRSQKYPQAIASYQGIIEKYPKSTQLPLAYLRIANSYFNSKDDANVIKSCANLIGRFPEAQEAIDALDLMDAVFDRSPKLDFQSTFAGIVKSQNHKKVAAQAQFRLATRLFDRKEYAKAAAEFQNFSVDYTSDQQLAKAQFMLAESLFQAGKFADAIPAFQRFLNNFPRGEDTPRALFHIGSAHYNLKEHEPATQLYQRLLEEYPETEFSKPAQFNLALAFKAVGKLDSAQEAYSKYIRSVGNIADPNAQSAMWEVFALQRDRKDYDAALDTLRRIADSSPNNNDVQLEATYDTAEIYAAMNRPDEAMNNLEKLRGLKPAGNAFRLKGLIRLGELYEKSEPAKAAGVYDDLAKNASSAQLRQSALERAIVLRGGRKGGKAANKLDDSGSNSGTDEANSAQPKKPAKKKTPGNKSQGGNGGGTVSHATN